MLAAERPDLVVADHGFAYVRALTRGTRVHSETPLPFLRQWVTWGAGPRAGLWRCAR